MADIFFSYAEADAPRVMRLAEALRAQGLPADADRSLAPGQSRVTEMQARLHAARVVVAVWSAQSVSSPQLLDEAGAARDQGKLVPVLIDAVESPIGFRQLQPADLAPWPSEASRQGLLNLTKALCGKLGMPAPQALKNLPFGLLRGGGDPGDEAAAFVPTVDEAMTQGRFLRSASFWIWTSVIAAFSGLMYFLSPAGVEEMGVDSASRLGAMLGNLLGALLVVGFGQWLIHLSRGWVGKRSTSYFSVEFLTLAALAAAFAALPETSTDNIALTGTGVLGLANRVNLAFLGFFLIGAPLIALVRGGLRLIRGKPRP